MPTDSHPAPEGKDDPAGAMLARLEADAELVDVGRFTVDGTAARGKLARYLLANTNHFVLLLVEAGHLFPDCSGLDFELSDWRRRTTVRFHDVELPSTELHACFDALFAAEADLEGEAAARLRGRRFLALALNAAMTLGVVVLGSGTTWLRVDERGMTPCRAPRGMPAAPGAMTILRLDDRYADDTKARRRLLRQRARFSRIPLRVDGKAIDHGLHPNWLLDARDVVDPRGRVIGRSGWIPDHDEPGRILFIVNGVALETHEDDEVLARGSLTLIEASDLRRDLSLNRLRRGKIRARRLEIARAVQLGPAPVALSMQQLSLHAQVAATVFVAAVSIIAGMVIFAVAGMPLWAIVGPALLVPLAAYAKLRPIAPLSERQWRGLKRGVPALGTVTRVSPIQLSEDTSLLRLYVQARPAQGPMFDTSITVKHPQETPLPEPGSRLWMVVDPRDPRNAAIVDKTMVAEDRLPRATSSSSAQ